MLLNISNLHKSIGSKVLMEELSFRVNEGEKIALIGRNGTGKTTLFKMIEGRDKDFSGEITKKKDSKIILTEQEHIADINEINVLDYVLNDLPKYRELQSTISSYSDKDADDHEKLQNYTDAIMEFSELGYYQVEEQIIETLDDFGIGLENCLDSLGNLSGGQKRFVELVRVMYSKADLALIDEPTNHMDYIGKEKFIAWLKKTKQTILVISHDRDVLKYVDRIFELRDKDLSEYPGNYDAYLKQNSLQTVSGISEYEIGLKRLEKLKKQINEARVVKLKSRDQAARIREERFQREYDELKEILQKPSFWIDQTSVENLSDKVVDKYEKYKEKNININTNAGKEHKRELVRVTDLSVGYEHALFKNLHFTLDHGDKIFVKGRNGAGKTTLVRTIISKINEKEKVHSQIFHGDVKISPALRLGMYEQEIDEKYLEYKLHDAVLDMYHSQRLDINVQKVRNILAQYLFDPMRDGDLEIKNLSGGQKARFQIIKMLSNNPNLLILDEPTNHLDLPSIEELENALLNYHGAVIYISHDNYFIERMGGEVIRL